MMQMKQWLRMGRTALLGGLLTAGLMLPSVTMASPQEDIQYVQEVCQQYRQQGADNLTAHLTFLSAAAQAEGNVTMHGTFLPSMLVQGRAEGSCMTVIGLGRNATVPFYLEQSDKQLTVYYMWAMKWQKIEVPFSMKEYAELMQESMDLHGIKSVKVVSDQGAERTLEITLDKDAITKELYKNFDKQSQLADTLTPEKKAAAQQERAEQQQILTKMCEAMHDYQFTWVVDKATKQIRRESVDLTPMLHDSVTGVLSAMSDEIPPEHQQILQRLTESCTLKMEITHQPVKAGDKVVIPAKVRKAELVQAPTVPEVTAVTPVTPVTP